MTVNLKIRALLSRGGSAQNPRCPVRAHGQVFVDVLFFIISYSAFTLGPKMYQEKEKVWKPCLTRTVVLNVNFST
jgi:hypothetical protein